MVNDNNGVWTYELNNIHDILAEFIQNWLEDNINHELYDNGIETANNKKRIVLKLVIELFDYFNIVEKFLRVN